MSDELKRYNVPSGHGIAPHDAGLLYHKNEVDPFIENLRAQLAAAEAKRDRLRVMLSQVNEVMFSATWGEYQNTKHIDGAKELKEKRLALFRETRATLQALHSPRKGPT